MKKVLIVAVVGALGLVGCGGGGGADNATVAAPPTVTITAANQGSIARAVVDGGQAFGDSQPFAATAGTTAQSAATASAARRTGALQSMVRRGLGAAFAPHRTATIATATRPAATTTTTDACAVSGSVTTAIGDVDGSQSLSSGDSLAVTFNQCNDSDAVMNGG